jgi:hypothetical protein
LYNYNLNVYKLLFFNIMTSHVSWENKFEVMYTREQVNYEAENIMELLISHIIYVY